MKRLTAIGVILVLFSAGCATTGSSVSGSGTDGDPTLATGRPHPLKAWMAGQSRAKKRGLVGAITGAAAGALGAAILGKDPWEGAVVGAVTGGIAGFVSGRRKDELFAGRDRAIELLGGYDPSQGYIFQVESVEMYPPNPGPGGAAELRIRYLVLGPDPHESLEIQSFTGVRADQGYVMGQDDGVYVVPNGGGVVNTTSTLTVPKDAPTGTYSVEAVFEDPAGRFQATGSQSLYVS